MRSRTLRFVGQPDQTADALEAHQDSRSCLNHKNPLHDLVETQDQAVDPVDAQALGATSSWLWWLKKLKTNKGQVKLKELPTCISVAIFVAKRNMCVIH